MPKTELQVVYAVIIKVPAKVRDCKLRERRSALSACSRQALTTSAFKGGIRLGRLNKNEDGAPMPFNGYFWSVSDKTSYVAAVVAPYRVGIDLEEIRLPSDRLWPRIAKPSEWRMGGQRSALLFCRYWTAKEAVLKAAGIGLKGLSRCRVVEIVDPFQMVLGYEDLLWEIEHVYFDRHLAAIVKEEHRVEWIMSSDHLELPAGPITNCGSR